MLVYQKYFKKDFKENIAVNKDENTKEENNLVNIVYESIDKEGRKYIIKAESGLFNEQEPDIIFMTNVNAKIILLDGDIIYIKSSNAEYNSLNSHTEFQKDVKLKF